MTSEPMQRRYATGHGGETTVLLSFLDEYRDAMVNKILGEMLGDRAVVDVAPLLGDLVLTEATGEQDDDLSFLGVGRRLPLG